MVLEVGELLNSVKNPFCVVCSNPCSGICYKGTKLEEAYEILKKADAIVMEVPYTLEVFRHSLKHFLTKRES